MDITVERMRGHVNIELDGGTEDLTFEQARELAARLLAAAGEPSGGPFLAEPYVEHAHTGGSLAWIAWIEVEHETCYTTDRERHAGWGAEHRGVPMCTAAGADRRRDILTAWNASHAMTADSRG